MRQKKETRYLVTYDGQPSNVDTVKSVSIAFATSSKWKRCWHQFLSFMIGLLILPFSNSRYVPLKLTISNERYYWLRRFSYHLIGRNRRCRRYLEIGQQEKSVYVYSRIAVATTPNDIPRLRLCVRLRDNLLAFLLGHFRCIGTIEKFSLYNIKIPLMWSRSLWIRGFAFFKLAKRIDTPDARPFARVSLLFLRAISREVDREENREFVRMSRVSIVTINTAYR